MPTAGDAFLNGALPLSNPLNRINYNPFQSVFDLTKLLDEVVQFVEDFLFPAIKQLTGIDLSSFLPEIKAIITNLETIFGDLNPSTFNPLAAAQAFINLIVDGGLSFPQSIVTNLAADLATAGGALRDALINAVNGGSTTGNAIADVIATLDSFFGGIKTNQSATNNSLSSLFDQAASVLGIANSAQTTAQSAANSISAQTFNNSLYHAVDRTLEGVFHLTSLPGGTPSTMPVTQVKAPSGHINIETTATKSTFVWYGGGVTGITAAYGNLYKIDTATDVRTRVWQSGNLLPYMGSAIDWVYVPMTPIDVVQGEVYQGELQTVGPGTHTIIGLPGHWLNSNPNVIPSQLAASRTALAAPLFDAASTGWQLPSAATSLSGSWTHTATAGATVFVATQTVATSTSLGSYSAWPTRTVTYGGTPMTQVGVVNSNNSTSGWVALYRLDNVPGGAQTVTWTVSGHSQTIAAACAASVSYTNVGTVGTAVTNYGSGTSLTSGAVSSDATGHTVINVFGAGAGSTLTLSAYNHTQRVNTNGTTGSEGSPLIMGDAAGAASVSFSATDSGSGYWGSVSVDVTGTPIMAPATIDPPTYSPDVPWVALSSQTSGTTGRYAPELTPYTTPGTYTYPIPAWMVAGDKIDFAVLSAGGTGGSAIGYGTGQGGAKGNRSTGTLVYGTDIPLSTTTLTVAVGASGGDDSYGSDGPNGGASSLSGTGVTTITQAGGLGGGRWANNLNGNGLNGTGPGTVTLNGVTYPGGSDVGASSVGNAPGGGGGGGFSWLPGGAGADGYVGLRAYQH